MEANLALHWGAGALVVLAAITDWRTRRIPNRLLLAGWLLAIALHSLAGTPLQAWLGGALGLLLFLPLYLLRGMAAGDVKLLATVGALCGPLAVLGIAFASCAFGGLMAIGVTLAKGRTAQLMANLHQMLLRVAGHAAPPLAPEASVGQLPYGLAIAAGTLFELCLRHVF